MGVGEDVLVAALVVEVVMSTPAQALAASATSIQTDLLLMPRRVCLPTRV